ncbi:MAG TPA: hypothetical protein PKN56_18460 [Leptospiraceae bacterium]|nr:hypothetical protein [Leptospiraceae bacterium]
MKFKSILVLLFAAVLAVSNCNNKKDTSARDSLLFTFLAGMAGSGSGAGSCVLNSGSMCIYTVGPMPAGFNFASNCTNIAGANTGTYNASKDCASQGYTKCANDTANTFGGYSMKCTK